MRCRNLLLNGNRTISSREPPCTSFDARSLSCILPPQIVQIGVVGVPNLCNEIQLRDFEEAGYKADGSGEHAKGRPQGEVCLRGPNVFKGYCEFEGKRSCSALAARRD